MRKLSRTTQARMLATLRGAGGGFVPNSVFYVVIWGDETPPKSAQVIVSQLVGGLRSQGYPIFNVYKLGYFLLEKPKCAETVHAPAFGHPQVVEGHLRQ